MVSTNGSTPYPAVPNRYHLYISLACPWASRTLIVRNLNWLQHVIGVTVIDPVRDERGWAFRDGPGYSHDAVNGFQFFSEAYVVKAFSELCRCRNSFLLGKQEQMKATEAIP